MAASHNTCSFTRLASAPHQTFIMVAISALITVLPAFLAVTHASPALKRSSGNPASINGDEAKALLEKGPLHVRDSSLCQQITMAQLNTMTDALNDAKVCLSSSLIDFLE